MTGERERERGRGRGKEGEVRTYIAFIVNPTAKLRAMISGKVQMMILCVASDSTAKVY